MMEKIEPTLYEVDLIEQPPHYTNGGIEPIDYITSNNMRFLEGNIVKYLTRYPYKGSSVSDLHKCRFYLNKLIEEVENAPNE